ncbi:iron-sulfur cluster-binding domain-containing protein [Nocardioides zeae]|uniref:Iron-sulfur cluster-binding domain-containing protein n=1 Tax=Nocardioides imazamoxiresistens TaxID=3231893 RepID=A0ABU3PVW7_9ACTN|nr:iron-sulfur cluster-binding domain-containing protein [Nocardioides zeae]MDT9593324.1 iron-sulfur cluster-binding domain-containing protein [Nocardioides zeae]
MTSLTPLLQAQTGLTGRRAAWASLRTRLEKVANAAVTPLVPADYLDLFHPLRAGAELRGRVVSVESETADAATIVIRPGSDWAGHVPGQYVRVGVDVDGVRQWRAYSLTHGPRRDGCISITVKAVPEGVVSNHLVHRVRVGTLLHLEQATGEFVLAPEVTDGPDVARLLFVTAGSGVTPVVGMLRNLFPVTDSGVVRPRRSAHLDITVVHVAPSRPDSIFLRDLEALDAAGAIRLVARYDDAHGFLDVDDLESLVPDLAGRTTYACGPGGLLDVLTAHHEARGLPLFTEQFRPSTLVVGEGGTVSFRNGATVEADGSSPLLDVGEAAGVLMPSGCRMGVCFGCVIPLKEGAVRDLRNGEVTTAVPGETGPEGVRIQTCITAAAGPCHLDI